MRGFSVLVGLCALSVLTTIASLVGCSGGSAISPPSSTRDGQATSTGLFEGVFDPARLTRLNLQSGHQFTNYNNCPAKGSIKYVSDANNNVINVYAGKFAGQLPCAQIASGLSHPWGLYVERATHDLYVANGYGLNFLVYHRGQTTPYNTYTDPTSQVTSDVTIANDGTVIASNQSPNLQGPGSISTWLRGPNGGTFVGNFVMTNSTYGEFITIRENGTVYYDDFDSTTFRGALWFVSCPAGHCGVQTQVSGTSIYPGGLAFDVSGDLVMNDYQTRTADTFELPNPNPKTFPLVGIPQGVAISERDRHWFVADAQNNNAAEYEIPGGRLVGTVPGNSGGAFVGIAIDP